MCSDSSENLRKYIHYEVTFWEIYIWLEQFIEVHTCDDLSLCQEKANSVENIYLFLNMYTVFHTAFYKRQKFPNISTKTFQEKFYNNM